MITRSFLFVICGNESIGTPLRANTRLHIRQEENLLRVEGRDTSAYSGGPGHILILMGVLLIPAFLLCISGLSYQRVIGLIGCGPGIMVVFFLLSKQQRIGTCLISCPCLKAGINIHSLCFLKDMMYLLCRYLS